MRNFLFEQYGYYPKDIKDREFFINGWKFELIPTELQEENITSIENYVGILNDKFNNRGPFIVKNKSGNKSSIYNNEYHVLITIFLFEMKMSDLVQFHYLFYQENEEIELDRILEAWKTRIDNLEKKLGNYLRADSIFYKENLDISMFAIGLGINAMQYLSDIIHNYSNKLKGVTIVHKRLKDLNSFDLLNPLNFIVETPLKDLCLLYQSGYIGYEELMQNISKYKVDVISASFLMARLLYRVDIFDFLETKRGIEDKQQQIIFDIEHELDKIKKAYRLLKQQYLIRPIDWLEEN